MKLLQDDSLIRRAAAQDAAAFEQLMLLHQKPVYNICWRMAGNAEDALDLSQEVFLKLWRTLAQYQFDAAFSTASTSCASRSGSSTFRSRFPMMRTRGRSCPFQTLNRCRRNA